MLRKCVAAAASGLLLFLGAASLEVLAQGLGAGSPTDTTLSLSPSPGVPLPGDPPSFGAGVGYGDPIPVSLDLQGPVWSVHLLPVSPGIPAGAYVGMANYLVISGQRPWTGWRMDLLTPGLEWQYVDPDLFGNVNFWADGVTPAGYDATLVGSSLVFSFDPLPPGTQVRILFTTTYTGTSSLTAPVELQQFPTPEPATVTMVGLVCAFIVRRRVIWARGPRLNTWPNP